MNDDFSKLKPGDKVITRSSMGSGIHITTVDRITPTGQIRVLGESRRYTPAGREIVSDRWATRRHLMPWTQEAEDAYNHRVATSRAVDKVVKTDFRKLSLEKLNRIIEIIEEES